MGFLTIMKSACIGSMIPVALQLWAAVFVSTKAKVEDRHRHIQIFISLRLDASY